MRIFVFILASVFITLSLSLPENDSKKESVSYNDNQTGEKESEIIQVYEADNKQINLTQNKKKIENGRVWGNVGHYDWMVYENVDGYIYVNGEFHPTKGHWENNEFLLMIKEFEKLFDVTRVNEDSYEANNQSQLHICKTSITPEDVIERLDSPSIPIELARITTVSGQMPGASREYRNGYHEGFDWYPGAVGVNIDKETKVYPVYEGRIVRIDKNYVELETEVRETILTNETIPEKRQFQKTLDLVRGRQVWIQSDNGVLAHYAHLDSVNEELNVGDIVDTNTYIGKTGNSGTSNGSLNTDEDVHLHLDLLVCGKNFWEYGDVDQLNNDVIEIFESLYEYNN